MQIGPPDLRPRGVGAFVLRVVLGTWVVLLGATTALFVLVTSVQALLRTTRTAARRSVEHVRPALEARPAEQRSAA